MTATTAHSPTLGLALLVALAGGVGAMARALLIHHISARRSDPLPIGTVVENAAFEPFFCPTGQAPPSRMVFCSRNT